jgi:tripartite-type tricarboxylate transporter receptor subunit TctC
VLLKRLARIDVVHVPVSGGAGPSIQALIAGDVHFGLLNIATGMPLLQKGQRLSVMPVSKEHFAKVLSMASAKTTV